MKLISIVGYAKSGKSALAEALTRLLVTRGDSVLFVKHTHHDLPTERGGDTERVLLAGAAAAIVLNDPPQGRRFESATSLAIEWTSLHELLLNAQQNVAIIEGFKSLDLRPRVLVEGTEALEVRCDAVVTNATAHRRLPTFHPSQTAELLAFLDTIDR